MQFLILSRLAGREGRAGPTHCCATAQPQRTARPSPAIPRRHAQPQRAATATCPACPPLTSACAAAAPPATCQPAMNSPRPAASPPRNRLPSHSRRPPPHHLPAPPPTRPLAFTSASCRASSDALLTASPRRRAPGALARRAHPTRSPPSLGLARLLLLGLLRVSPCAASDALLWTRCFSQTRHDRLSRVVVQEPAFVCLDPTSLRLPARQAALPFGPPPLPLPPSPSPEQRPLPRIHGCVLNEPSLIWLDASFRPRSLPLLSNSLTLIGRATSSLICTLLPSSSSSSCR